MANKKFIYLNRKEIKVFIIRNYDNEKQFCKIHKINYLSFRKYMAGDNSLSNINLKIATLIYKNANHKHYQKKFIRSLRNLLKINNLEVQEEV